jgi:hypothetical protein
VIRVLGAALLAAAFLSPAFAQSPPAGGGGAPPPTKTASYTIKSTDLNRTLSFDCPAGCTATMPQITASWPKGYPVTILNVGTIGTVTVHATPTSTIFGMVPAGSADVLLTAQGNYATLTANNTNQYLAMGLAGAAGPGPVVSSFVLRHGGGHISRHAGGSVQRHAP